MFEQVSDFLSAIDLAQLAKEWATSPTGLSGTHAFKPLMTLLYGESEEPRTHDPETGIPYAAAMENPFSRPGGSRQSFIGAESFYTDEEPMGGMPASGPKGVAKVAQSGASLLKRAEALASRQWKAMTGKGAPVKTPTPTVTSTGKPVKRVTTKADAASAQAKKDARSLDRKRARQEARLKKLERTPSYYDDTGGVIGPETLQRRFGSGPHTSGNYQGIVHRIGDSFKVYDPEVPGKVAGIYPSRTAAIRALKELRYQAGIVRGRNLDAYSGDPRPGLIENYENRVSVSGLDQPGTPAVEQSRYLRGYEPGGEYYKARQEEGYVRPPPDRTKIDRHKDDVRTSETLRTKRADAKKEEAVEVKTLHTRRLSWKPDHPGPPGPKPKVIGRKPSQKSFDRLSPAEQAIFKMGVRVDVINQDYLDSFDEWSASELKDWLQKSGEYDWDDQNWDDQDKLDAWKLGKEAVERARLGRPNVEAATPNPYLESLEILEAKKKALKLREKALLEADKFPYTRETHRKLDILREEDKELQKEFQRWTENLGKI